MLYIKQTQTTIKGTYTANEDGEGDAEHHYEMRERNGYILELKVDDEDMTGDQDWEETILAVVRGQKHTP
jgi:hypothetical protein